MGARRVKPCRFPTFLLVGCARFARPPLLAKTWTKNTRSFAIAHSRRTALAALTARSVCSRAGGPLAWSEGPSVPRYSPFASRCSLRSHLAPLARMLTLPYRNRAALHRNRTAPPKPSRPTGVRPSSARTATEPQQPPNRDRGRTAISRPRRLTPVRDANHRRQRRSGRSNSRYLPPERTASPGPCPRSSLVAHEASCRGTPRSSRPRTARSRSP